METTDTLQINDESTENLSLGEKKVFLTLSILLLLFQKIAARSRALLPAAQKDKKKVS